jgi:hypothetical protein
MSMSIYRTAAQYYVYAMIHVDDESVKEYGRNTIHEKSGPKACLKMG